MLAGLTLALSIVAAAPPDGIAVQLVCDVSDEAIIQPAELAAALGDAFLGTSLTPVAWDESEKMARARAGKAPDSCGFDTTCLAHVGDAVGARFVISAGVARVGHTVLLDFIMVDVATGREKIARTSVSFSTSSPERDAYADALRTALPPDLVKPLALLDVQGAPLGSSVSVDGAIIGTAPLQRAILTSAGLHRIEARDLDPKAPTYYAEVDAESGARAGVRLMQPPGFLRRHRPLLLPGGLALVSAAIGIGFAIATNAAAKDYDALACASPCEASGEKRVANLPPTSATQKQLDSLDTRGAVFRGVAWASFAAATGFAGWTVWRGLRADSQPAITLAPEARGLRLVASY